VLSSGLLDLLLLVAATGVASFAVFGMLFPWQATPRPGESLMPLVAVMLVGASAASLVTVGMSGPGVPRPSYGRGAAIVVTTLVTTAVTQFMFRDMYYSRAFVGDALATWMAFITVHRYLRRRKPWTERISVITAEKHLADQLGDSTHVDMQAVIDPQSEDHVALLPPGTTLAVDMRAILSDRVAQYVSSCDIAGYPVRPLASVYEEHTGRIPLVHLSEGWEITTPLVRTSSFLPGKRLFDLIVVGVLVPLWVPVMAVVALTVKLSSPGPVIFSQRRVGLNGRPFVLYKFRTMHVDAERDGPRMAQDGDDRIVRGAGLLRRIRFDELPQIWNVIKGDMSLVGPRAEQLPFVRQFRRRIPFYDQRHLVRPGLTGWAQVNQGYAADAANTVEKLSYDLYYVKHMSPILDLQILWKTIWTVMTGDGAR
jgi:exopolysaccharide biosynthesis polyprenyl glycosylphosphotransferase